MAVEGEYNQDAEHNLIRALGHLATFHMPILNQKPDYLVIAVEPVESAQDALVHSRASSTIRPE